MHTNDKTVTEQQMAELKPGSLWRHYNGREYRILFLANVAHSTPEHQPNVVYERITNGHKYVRPVSDWSRSMTRIEASPDAGAKTQRRLEPGRFTIAMEGGSVKAVVSNDPALVGAAFSVIDYDIEDVDPVWNIIQSDESVYPAGGYTSVVETPGIDLDHIYADPDAVFIEDKT